jgi:hypothetical protein
VGFQIGSLATFCCHHNITTSAVLEGFRGKTGIFYAFWALGLWVNGNPTFQVQARNRNRRRQLEQENEIKMNIEYT